MRLVFGTASLVALNSGFGLSASGLHEPANLLPSLGGAAVPDLTDHLGALIEFTAQLVAPGENLTHLGLHFIDLRLAVEGAAATPLKAVVSGNLGKPPELNPKGDRVSASLAYSGSGDATSWLRLTAHKAYAIAEQFASREKGTTLIAVGTLESYVYNNKPNVQLVLDAFEQVALGSGYKPPVSLASSFSDADAAPAHAFEEA
jgi:hypothetical protein